MGRARAHVLCMYQHKTSLRDYVPRYVNVCVGLDLPLADAVIHHEADWALCTDLCNVGQAAGLCVHTASRTGAVMQQGSLMYWGLSAIAKE